MTRPVASSLSRRLMSAPGIAFTMIAVLTAIVSSSLPGAASAGTLSTWTGGGSDANWATSGNFSTTITTVGDFDLVFGGTTKTANSNNVGTVNVSSILFSNAGTSGQTSAFAVSGSPLALANSSISTTIATSGSLGTATSSGDVINNILTLSGSNTVTAGSNHNLSLLGNISGTGSITFASSGSGTTPFVYLGGSNDYSGNTLITGGNVQTTARTGGNAAGSSTAFGSGNVSVNGGTILLRNGSTLNNNLTLSGTGVAGDALTGSFGQTSTATITGTITLAANAAIGTASSVANDTTSKLVVSGPVQLGANTLTFRPDRVTSRSNVIEMNGVIAGSGGLVVASPSGVGRVLLNAANTFTGPTNVNAGVLSGTGSVAGPVNVNAGGVFDPGANANATTFFGVGSYSQVTGGTTRLQVNGLTAGSQYDQVLFSGTSKTVSWGGKLELTLSGSYANNTGFNLFSGFTSQSGNLGEISLSAGSPYSGLSFSGPVGSVWYTGTTAAGQYLTFNQTTGVFAVVPEPGTVSLAAIGAALGFCHRMLRRSRTAKKLPS